MTKKENDKTSNDVQKEEALLRYDFIFKSTFDKKEFLIRLLEETLNLKVKDLVLVNTEMPGEDKNEKRKILDMIVYTDDEVIKWCYENNIDL